MASIPPPARARRTSRHSTVPRGPSPVRAGGAPPGSGGAGHDTVVAAAGAGTPGAGPVAGQHLRGDPAVQFHQVALGAAALQPGMAERVPEPVRVNPTPALSSARATAW
jgi:hypothetical protein